MARKIVDAFVFSVGALLCLGLFLTAFCGCGAEAQRLQNLDNGRTVIRGRTHIQPLPVRVDCTCSDIRCDVLAEAAGWWNEQMAGYGHEGPVVLVTALPVPMTRPHLCVHERDLPPGVYSLEVAKTWRLISDTETMASSRAHAYVQPDHWWPAVLTHLFGHYMGLADDPPTTPLPGSLGDEVFERPTVWSTDLRSIMQSDAPPWGEVTPGDAYLLMHPHEAVTGLEEW